MSNRGASRRRNTIHAGFTAFNRVSSAEKQKSETNGETSNCLSTVSRVCQLRLQLFFFGIDFEVGQATVKRSATDAEETRRQSTISARAFQRLEKARLLID